MVGSSNRKSRVLEWETADKLEKGIVGSWNRKSRGLEGETAGEFENRIVGSRSAEKTRAQSPKSNFCNGGDPLSQKKKDAMLVKKCFNGRPKFDEFLCHVILLRLASIPF